MKYYEKYCRIKLFLSLFILFLSLNKIQVHAQTPVPTPIPRSGLPNQKFQNFEEKFAKLLQRFDIPGGSVAIMKDGELVYARGFGFANLAKLTPVQPQSLFRIASITKALTAIAVMQLVEKSRLSLDDKAFSILNQIKPLPGAKVDARIYQITVRNLLSMSGGWKRGRHSSEKPHPRFSSREEMFRYMMGVQLDFDPGTEVSYNNFGYNVLGAIVEKVSGQPFEAYVQQHILNLLEIHDMKIGKFISGPGEVSYYVLNQGKPTLSSAGRNMQLQFGSGGWIASASDLVKIFSAVKGLGKLPRLLSSKTVEIMTAKPDIPTLANRNRWYALGWNVTMTPGGQRWTKDGGLAGTRSFLVLSPNGVAVAGIVNSGPQTNKDEWRRGFQGLLIEAANFDK